EPHPLPKCLANPREQARTRIGVRVDIDAHAGLAIPAGVNVHIGAAVQNPAIAIEDAFVSIEDAGVVVVEAAIVALPVARPTLETRHFYLHLLIGVVAPDLQRGVAWIDFFH